MSEQRQYRGKRVDNGEWAYGWYVPIKEQAYIFLGYGLIKSCSCCDCCDCQYDSIATTTMHEVIPESVGQSTGVKDKCGVEIYGGDLYDPALGPDLLMIVFWDEKRACFGFKRPGNRPSAFIFGQDECATYGTIIGNTTDSPELLENKDHE